MFFTACEILQRGPPIFRFQNAQVRLHPVVRDDGRFRVTFRQHLAHLRQFHKRVDYRLRFVRHGKQINIADGRTHSAQTSARRNFLNGCPSRLMQLLHQFLRKIKRDGEPHARRVQANRPDALFQIFDGFFADARQIFFGILQRVFQLVEGGDVELFPKFRHRFRTDAGNGEQLNEPFRHLRADFFVITHLAGAKQFVQFFRNRFANAVNRAQVRRITRPNILDAARGMFDHIRRALIRDDFETVLAQNRKNIANAVEQRGDFLI